MRSLLRGEHDRLPSVLRQELGEAREADTRDAADRREVVGDDQDPPHRKSIACCTTETTVCSFASALSTRAARSALFFIVVTRSGVSPRSESAKLSTENVCE